MQFTLHPHPTTPPAGSAFKVWATVDHIASLGAAVATTNIWFGVGAPAARFVIPRLSEPWRADDLWRTTCFEAFLRSDEKAYREWNFAPSGNWAAYDFSNYREDMTIAEVESPPYIRMEDNFTWWTVGATIAVEASPQWHLGLSAILEESDGTRSYWALAHPPGDKPDFHHPDCFMAQLA